MDNMSKIKKFSKIMHLLLSFLLAAIPLYYLFYWLFINHIPETFISVNKQPVPLIPNELPVQLQAFGFVASFLPLSALVYGIVNIRKLFAYYKEGVIFSLDHVVIFKKTAKALILWVILSIFYESAKSIIFSMGNPPGSRVISVGFSSAELTTLFVGTIVFIIAWVMDEARILTEENQLTI